MFLEYIIYLDSEILLYIQEHIRNELLSSILIPYTHLGDGGILWTTTALVLLCFKQTRRIGLVCVIAILIGFIVTNLTLKDIVARTRPFYAIDNLVALINYPKDYSFPSGHSTSWFAGSFSIFLTVNKRKSWILLVSAVLMGFSRLYVGVHYPTDVLCGIVIGIGSAIASYYIVKALYRRYAVQKL